MRPSRSERLLVLVLFTLVAAFAFPRLIQSPPAIGPDAFVFEYGGWLFASGHPPYVTIWDVKPPGVYYLTGALALLSGRNPIGLHWLAVGVNAGCVCVAVVASMRLVRNLTDDGTAALATAAAFVAYPSFYALPATGFRPKFAVLALTATALYWYAIDRQNSSLLTAMIAPTFWQPAVIVPIVIAVASLRSDRSSWPEVASIGGVTTTVVVVPIALVSGIDPLITQTVVAPLVASEPFEPLRHVMRGGYFLAFAAPVALAGGLELLRQGRRREQFWLVIPFCAFAGYATVADLDGPPDLLLAVLFTAIGVGLLVGRIRAERQRQILEAIVVAALLNGLIVASGHPLAPSYVPPVSGLPPFDHVDPTLFWDRRVPDSCHLRFSGVERQWLDRVGSQDCIG